MKNVKIEVDKDKNCKDFMVSVTGDFTYTIDNFFDRTSIHFFLDADKLDSLAFQSSSALQEEDRKKEQDNLKASEELREVVEENVSKYHEEPVRREE